MMRRRDRALFPIEQNQRISWSYAEKNLSDRPSVEEIIAVIDNHSNDRLQSLSA